MASREFTQERNLESRAKKVALHKVPLFKSSPDGEAREEQRATFVSSR